LKALSPTSIQKYSWLMWNLAEVFAHLRWSQEEILSKVLMLLSLKERQQLSPELVLISFLSARNKMLYVI
jgi:hypothetical protein